VRWPEPTPVNAPVLCSTSCYHAEQLTLENEFPFLILLRCLIGLVVLPPHCLIAVFAFDVSHDVSSRRHVPLHGFGLLDVDNSREEVGFAMLAAEVARYYIVKVGEVGFAVLRGERVSHGCVAHWGE
jgi:hypothetical protein